MVLLRYPLRFKNSDTLKSRRACYSKIWSRRKAEIGPAFTFCQQAGGSASAAKSHGFGFQTSSESPPRAARGIKLTSVDVNLCYLHIYGANAAWFPNKSRLNWK